MKLEDELTAAFVETYKLSGERAHYWPNYFLRAVRKDGGLATAKRMLLPRNPGQRKGLDALLEANCSELTVEAIIQQPKFRRLFTKAELATAAERLEQFRKEAKRKLAGREGLYPEVLDPNTKYAEGSKKRVWINAYERSEKAREACLTHHGRVCAVCGVEFEKRYGKVGKGFIHVHHLKPMALTDGKYELDPVKDLRPVCPNCHAMLHRPEKMLSIEELRKRLR